MDLLNKRVRHKSLSLIFSDCRKCVFRINPSYVNDITVNMARMMNGNIFVDFVGLGLTFECKSIKEDEKAYYYYFI